MNAGGGATPYAVLIATLREFVDGSLPAGSVVAVASRGDEDLVRFARHRGWHFPRGPHGLYAGFHPADADAALREVERVREQGAQYLLFPRTAAWWFEFYRGFEPALRERFDCVAESDDCAVFALEPEAPAADARGIDRDASDPVPELIGAPLQRSLVTVIVPIFNATDAVRRCVDSLLRNTPHPHQVLLADDASTDPAIAPLLRAVASAHPRIRVATNRANAGYTRTIRVACRLAPGDVVLLNSDTEVTPAWLDKLLAAAASRDDIATVTPLSNAAGAFSVPRNNTVNELPPGATADTMAREVDAWSRRVRPVVPTGNGFCMFIARRALDAVGSFDAENFPRGYGEENDFCQRARAAGFVNVIDDATYIAHARSASFGAEKEGLLAAAQATLARLHRDYRREVAAWLARDPLDRLREDLLRGAAPDDPRPVLLTVLHDGSGGTPMTAEDLLRHVSNSYRPLVLKTGVDAWTLWERIDGRMVTIRRYRFPDAWRYAEPLDSDRLRVLSDLIAGFDIRLAHVRHLLGNGPETVAELRRAGVPVVLSFHDFYTACPTIQLVDGAGRHCGGVCTPGDEPCPLAPSWFRGDPPPLKHRFVHRHRERMAGAIRAASERVVTSATSIPPLLAAFPFLRADAFRVIEHGRDLPRANAAGPPRPGERARIVCLGNIDRNKGADLIERLLAIDARAGRRFEFHFLGGQSSTFRPETLGGIHHGRYERDDLPGILKVIAPSFSLIASIWPETYCHTLTESWAAGIPVFASKLGAPAERVARSGGGWLFDPHDADAWHAGMIRVLEAPELFTAAVDAIARMGFRTAAEMAADYEALYAECARTRNAS